MFDNENYIQCNKWISNFSNSTNLPLTINGQNEITSIKYEIPVSSAQVKTAVLLAGLNARGTTQIIEPQTSRNHTENLLKYFGADIFYKDSPIGKNKVSIKGGKIYNPRDGRFYKSKLKLLNNGNLKVEGCLLFFCDGEEWRPLTVTLNEDGSYSAEIKNRLQ